MSDVSNLAMMPLSLLAEWIKNNHKVDGVIILTFQQDNSNMVQLNTIGMDDQRIHSVLATGIYLNRKSALEEGLIG